MFAGPTFSPEFPIYTKLTGQKAFSALLNYYIDELHHISLLNSVSAGMTAKNVIQDWHSKRLIHSVTIFISTIRKGRVAWKDTCNYQHRQWFSPLAEVAPASL